MTGAMESPSPPAGSGTDGFRAESNCTGSAFAKGIIMPAISKQTAVNNERRC